MTRSQQICAALRSDRSRRSYGATTIALSLSLAVLPFSLRAEGPIGGKGTTREANGEAGGALFVPAKESLDLREGYALLASLVDDEASVDKVFLVKSGSPALRETIRAIAEAAQAVQRDLAAFRHGGGIEPFGPTGLPEIETETRKAIAGHKQKQILGGTRPVFEKELLLSQYEGLSYGTCLLQVLADEDRNPVRSRLLRRHALAWADLRQRVFEQIPTLK